MKELLGRVTDVSILCTWQEGILNEVTDKFFKLCFLFSFRSERITNLSPVIVCNLLTGSCSVVVGFYLLTASGYRHNWGCQKTRTNRKEVVKKFVWFSISKCLCTSMTKNSRVIFGWTKLPSITYKEDDNPSYNFDEHLWMYSKQQILFWMLLCMQVLYNLN